MVNNYVIREIEITRPRESPEWLTQSQSLELTIELIDSTNLTKSY